MEFLIGALLIAYLPVSVIIASLAEEKGYSLRWASAMCLLPVIGWIILAALPDRNLTGQLQGLRRDLNEVQTVLPRSGQLSANKCACGRILPEYVSSCSCGVSRHAKGVVHFGDKREK